MAAILGDGFIKGGQIKGINYGMPTNKELARQYGWVLRKDIVEAMGMDISTIKTMEDLEPWIIKAYEEHGLWSWNTGINPSFQYDRIEDPIIGMLPFAGSREVILTQLDQYYKDGVKMNNKWFNMGIVNPNLTREISVDAEFPSGKYFANTQQLKPGKAAELELNWGFPLVQIEMNEPEIITGETTGAMLAIPTASENKDEAFDFIALLYTDKTLVNLLVWGVEGTDYTKVSDNIIELKDSNWKPGHGWTMGNQLNDYLLTTENPKKWELFKEFNAVARPLDTLGFVADSSDVRIQSILANLRAIEQTMFDLQTGYVDDVDGAFADFESQFKAAGLDEALAYYQKQIDEFFANKKK